MADHAFRAYDHDNHVIEITMPDDVNPPYELPELLTLRRLAARLLREHPQLADAQRITVHQADAPDTSAPVTRVARAYLQPPPGSPPRPRAG